MFIQRRLKSRLRVYTVVVIRGRTVDVVMVSFTLNPSIARVDHLRLIVTLA